MLTKSGIDDNLTKKPLTLYGQDYDCADEIADKLALAKENTATDNLNEEEREEMEQIVADKVAETAHLQTYNRFKDLQKEY